MGISGWAEGAKTAGDAVRVVTDVRFRNLHELGLEHEHVVTRFATRATRATDSLSWYGKHHDAIVDL
jgi:hypothetical protein